jgi:hypothetical protein
MWSGFSFKRSSCSFNRDSGKRTLVCGIQPNTPVERAEVLGVRVIRIHEKHVLPMQNHCRSKKLLRPKKR